MKHGSGQTGWRIGELAQEAGIAISAIRFYEKRGLIAPPPRRSKWRIYDRDSLNRLKMIAQARQSGFSIAEIADVFALKERNGTRADIDAIVILKRKSLREKAREIQRQLSALDRTKSCTCITAADCAWLA